jgi:hypothetical protein
MVDGGAGKTRAPVAVRIARVNGTEYVGAKLARDSDIARCLVCSATV